MTKKLISAMLVISLLLAAGCAAPAPAEPVVEPVEQPAEAAPTPEPEPEIAYTLPQNDVELGTAGATVGELLELQKGGKPFYLYIDGEAPYDYAALEQGIINLYKDYIFPAEFYYTNESAIAPEELEQLSAGLGLSPAEVEGVSTYSGLYAFENGALKNSRFDFVPGEENANIPSSVINFIFESDLFRNDHGWEMISYEDLTARIDSGVRFMVYVGRDTCPYCAPFAKCLEAALAARPANLPLVYFYTQDYKTAINNAVDGAQEEWDGIKEAVGFQFTPSLLVFEGGEQVMAYGGGIDSAYFEMDDAAKEAARAAEAANIEEWLVDNILTDVM